jgi:hypothetical protein
VRIRGVSVCVCFHNRSRSTAGHGGRKGDGVGVRLLGYLLVELGDFVGGRGGVPPVGNPGGGLVARGAWCLGAAACCGLGHFVVPGLRGGLRVAAGNPFLLELRETLVEIEGGGIDEEIGDAVVGMDGGEAGGIWGESTPGGSVGWVEGAVASTVP